MTDFQEQVQRALGGAYVIEGELGGRMSALVRAHRTFAG